MTLASLLILGLTSGGVVFGESLANEQVSSGFVEVVGSTVTEIMDPERPIRPIEVEEDSPSTQGMLRIDHITPLNFGKVKIKETHRTYSALAYMIKNENLYRGNFIQVSDFREDSSGWTLQVKQEEQFRTENYDELTGAVLSLDKGWANSVDLEDLPIVTRDTIEISNIGDSYDVVRASKETGKGIWSLTFGASEDNLNNQNTTLIPEESPAPEVTETDREAPQEAGSDKKSTVLRNQAIQLTIPDKAKIVPGEYQAKFIWILGELP